MRRPGATWNHAALTGGGLRRVPARYAGAFPARLHPQTPVRGSPSVPWRTAVRRWAAVMPGACHD